MVPVPVAEIGEELGRKYRPYLLPKQEAEKDWITELELDTVERISREHLQRGEEPLRILVLYGSLRERRGWKSGADDDMKRSYSKFMAYEACRILHRLGVDVRVFDPKGLPMKDDVSMDHEKVQELRGLSIWSDGHIWCSPEQHGTAAAVFKNQIDWIPLSTGAVRPTQSRTLSIIQVNGGSQSFNTVNWLRILGRWMRMFTIPNQTSLPKAYTQFSDEGRLLASGSRDRLVDCMEEFVKYTWVMRPHFESWGDRFSERKQKREEEENKVREQREKEERDWVEKEGAEVEEVKGEGVKTVVAA
ncbi:arsenate resistance ArsH [Choiromyces venosus 120613-1]|uniref:Arsenate resistance ArsH n=1 Tax=Choiromyces venosus 120613-1 TaxID=1336337 RepID=A0A3N4JAS4_9PEZI|nr:arsenate resistance ArsH [Choiromyces venosus 120613-1]